MIVTMTAPNHYETLEIHPQATQGEIKQAYRRLVKRFHPDLNPQTRTSHEQITQINAAYEVLSDPYHRQLYDRQQIFSQSGYASQRAAAAQAHHRYRDRGRDTDAHLQAWLQQVYEQVQDSVDAILDPLPDQIDQLADDPFDDLLMSQFQTYLSDCQGVLARAQQCFRSMPNPKNLAGAAASLYYCLNQIGDGLEELETFTLNYDDRYLHTGQELFRIARGLQREAEEAIKYQ
uniref:Heat shock protein DnaJ domain protein n=1 Tax=Cyanothece sp. (strain PCC 7425 / ATCC 29141) TaxID=395961 RepID=B8HVU2_CYAP4